MLFVVEHRPQAVTHSVAIGTRFALSRQKCLTKLPFRAESIVDTIPPQKVHKKAARECKSRTARIATTSPIDYAYWISCQVTALPAYGGIRSPFAIGAVI